MSVLSRFLRICYFFKFFQQQRISKPQSSTSTAPNLLSGDSQYDNWSNPYAKLALVCRICSKEQNPKTKSTWKQHWESHTDLKNFGCYVCEKRFRMKGTIITCFIFAPSAPEPNFLSFFWQNDDCSPIYFYFYLFFCSQIIVTIILFNRFPDTPCYDGVVQGRI